MDFKTKKLIIFDLDGTLIDSVPDLALAINHTMKSLNIKEYPEELIRSWVGNGASILVKRALSSNTKIDKNIDDRLYNDALTIFLEFYKSNLTNSTKLYPNIRDILEYLKSKDYTLAIVTNKPVDFIEPILQNFDISKYFSYCIGADSLDEIKPSAKPLIHVCNKLNISIQNSRLAYL